MSDNKALRSRLSLACEIAKINLSEANSYNVRMHVIEGEDLDIEITREKLDQLT